MVKGKSSYWIDISWIAIGASLWNSNVNIMKTELHPIMCKLLAQKHILVEKYIWYKDNSNKHFMSNDYMTEKTLTSLWS